uniref:Molybdopterin synthase catalytic subunit n=1 Tax=Ornithodoros turicata TaxID=34597 RepID=A0A2R5LJ38_9ACAR
MDLVELSLSKIDTEMVLRNVGTAESGAISVFIGTTRNHFQGKKVEKLSYEAYDPMALREMRRLCSLIREQWTVKNIAIIHRLGEVPIGEASVVIAVSAEHRQEPLDAVKWAIDELKSRVPIWKKEVYMDSSTEWKENKECFWCKP